MLSHYAIEIHELEDSYWPTVPKKIVDKFIRGDQKLRKRKSLALPSTLSCIAGSGSMRAISIAPIIVEKIAKNARSLSTIRRPGMNGTIRLL